MTPMRLLAKGNRDLESKLLWHERFRSCAAALAALAALVALVIVIGTNAAAVAARERILSCTDPGVAEVGVPASKWEHPPGDCYSESQARTGELLGEPAAGINTVVVAASACARAVVRDRDSEAEAQAATLACTRRALDAASGESDGR